MNCKTWLKKCEEFIISEFPRKMMVSLIVLLLFSSVASSQLFVKNSTSKPVIIAFGWEKSTSNYRGIMTKGWYSIEPGVTIQTILSFTSDVDSFFYYARSTDKSLKWEGEYKFLTSSEPFEIKNANMTYVKDQNPSYSWNMFCKKKVTFGLFETRKYTLKLTEKVYGATNETNNGFTLYGQYSLVQAKFMGSIKLYYDGAGNYKIEYNGSTPDGCIIEFNGDGNVQDDSGNLMFYNGDECSMECSFTSDKNLNLIKVIGDKCFYLHGGACNFGFGVYKKTTSN